MKNATRIPVTLAVLGALSVGVVGHIESDYSLARQIISDNHLATPEEVFKFVIAHKKQNPSGAEVFEGASFKELMSQDREQLWCDEGAIVIAVMVKQLGYSTRLVDLVGKSDGISHHTVLQIQQNGVWVTYDFTGRQSGVSPDQTVSYPSIQRIRAYPDWRQDLMLSNFFARKMAKKLRPYLK